VDGRRVFALLAAQVRTRFAPEVLFLAALAALLVIPRAWPY